MGLAYIHMESKGITKGWMGDFKYLQIPNGKLEIKHIPASRKGDSFTKFAFSVLGEAGPYNHKYDKLREKFTESPLDNPSQLDKFSLTELRVLLFRFQRACHGGGMSDESWKLVELYYGAIRKKLGNNNK